MIFARHLPQARAALAAILVGPAAPCLAFEGAYYGLSVGLHQSQTSTDQSLNKPNAGANPTTHANTIAGVAAVHPSADGFGVVGGGRAGYAWRIGSWIAGAEIEANYWGYDESGTATGSAPALFGDRSPTTTVTAKASWLFAVRPRLGYVLSDREMAYGVLGVAFSDLEYTSRTTILSNGGNVTTYTSSARAKPGVVLGLGYERMLTGRTSLRVDYEHIRFRKSQSTGDQTGTAAPDLDASSVTSVYKTQVNALRVGMTWRF